MTAITYDYDKIIMMRFFRKKEWVKYMNIYTIIIVLK